MDITEMKADVTAITKSIGRDSGQLLDNFRKPNGTPVTVY